MSFSKSKVERFNYYPTTSSTTSGPGQTARNKTSLSASLSSASSLSLSRDHSQYTPNRSGVMNSQRKQGSVLKRDGFKCHSTGTKKKPTSQRIQTTPMVLSRSCKVILPKHRCSPSLCVGRPSGNTASRKSEAWKNKNSPMKLKTPKNIDGNPDYHSEKSTIVLTPSDIFQTPQGSPQASECECQIEIGNLTRDTEQAFQEEGEIPKLAAPTTQSLVISPSSSFYSPPAHESTVIVKNANSECRGSVSSDDASISVTTPGRTPRRLTNRRSYSSSLENNSLDPSNFSPSPNLVRRSLGYRSSFANIEETGVTSIVTEDRYPPPPSLTNSQPQINRRRLTLGLDRSSTFNPATLVPLRDEEPIRLQLPTNSNAERNWPSWHLPNSIPPPILLTPFLDQDVDIGKYHRPIVIASSFYKWVMNIPYRRGRTNEIKRTYNRDVSKLQLPEHVRQSIIAHYDARWLERDLALSKTLLVQYVVHTIITTGGLGYQPSPQARRLLTKLKRQGRQVMREVTFHVIVPVKTALKAPEFWKSLAEFIGGQVFELL